MKEINAPQSGSGKIGEQGGHNEENHSNFYPLHHDLWC